MRPRVAAALHRQYRPYRRSRYLRRNDGRVTTHRFANLRIVERGYLAIDDQIRHDVTRRHLAYHLRCLSGDILQQRYRHIGGKGHVKLAGDKSQNARGAVLDHSPLDAVEIGSILFPILGIAHHFYRFAALELDKLKVIRADRVAAHVLAGHVAGIDRGVSGGKQREERGLLPIERANVTS